MSYDITTTFAGDMAFDADIDGHALRMDVPEALGGKNSGAGPKKIMLATLAGCTGMDVVSLLKKMRVDFQNFELITRADLTEEHPKVFSQVELIYRIKVDEKDKGKVEKAVKMSKEKYCGVSAMIAKNNPIDFKIEFL